LSTANKLTITRSYVNQSAFILVITVALTSTSCYNMVLNIIQDVLW